MAKSTKRNVGATRTKSGLPPENKAVTPDGYNTRVCVPAPMPVCCPRCRSSKTTMVNGVHYNTHFGVRYEHRVCGGCGFSFTATRRMTAEELSAKARKRLILP